MLKQNIQFYNGLLSLILLSIFILMTGCGGSNTNIERKIEKLSQKIDMVNARVDSVNLRVDQLLLATYDILEVISLNSEKIEVLKEASILEEFSNQLSESPYAKEEKTKDAIISDCHNIGAMAQRYYRIPTSMGGGGASFIGFEIDNPLLSENDNALYTVVYSDDKKVELRGTPKNWDYDWYIKTMVTKDDIRSALVYDY